MKYRLIDILACPICKNFPLKLIVIKENYYPKREVKLEEKPLCELYCGLQQKYIREVKEVSCEDCIKREVDIGILICVKCKRWYPILDEIPRMLPDELRSKNEDIAFLRKYRDYIPIEILVNGKPFNLKEM